MLDFESALEVTKSSHVIDLKQYLKWENEFGSAWFNNYLINKYLNFKKFLKLKIIFINIK